MRISDWSSDVCSSDLHHALAAPAVEVQHPAGDREQRHSEAGDHEQHHATGAEEAAAMQREHAGADLLSPVAVVVALVRDRLQRPAVERSEEHTSELQSLMRISYAVFCLKKKKNTKHNYPYLRQTTNTQIGT